MFQSKNVLKIIFLKVNASLKIFFGLNTWGKQNFVTSKITDYHWLFLTQSCRPPRRGWLSDIALVAATDPGTPTIRVAAQYWACFHWSESPAPQNLGPRWHIHWARIPYSYTLSDWSVWFFSSVLGEWWSTTSFSDLTKYFKWIRRL
jgi:hypothetical protein